jgi:hypothetical protein
MKASNSLYPETESQFLGSNTVNFYEASLQTTYQLMSAKAEKPFPI